jgi:peptide/nickel transport system substrate-binding protein
MVNFLFCVLILLAMAAYAGIETAMAAEKRSDKDMFVYALNAEPKTLDGLLADDFVAYNVTNNLYDNLIIQEPNGTLTPGLAESWTYNEAGDEITFKLRKGVKFHDGSEMTAADVKFTVEHDIKHPPAANLTSSMKNIEIIDDYTVKLTLKYPFSPIEYCIAGSQLAIVSKTAYEKNPAAFARNPVGTGPYKFVKWLSGDKITLTRHDDYWGGKPAIKDVTFKVITETATAIVALEVGEVDMIQPTVQDRDALMANPDITWYEVPQVSTYFLAMNNKRGLFKDKNMRLAMACGIDRNALFIGALNGIGSVNNTPMPPNIFGYAKGFEWYPYNPEKAKEYLATAGYPNGLTVTFTTMNNEAFVRPTEILQDQLRKIGVTVVIDKMDRAAYLDKVITAKGHEVCVMSATAFYPDSDYLYVMYHSDPTEQGRNYHLNEDPVLDKLLEDARVSKDPETRRKLYWQVAERFKEEAIQVPLYVPLNSAASNAKLKGFEISPLRRLYIKYLYWTD